MTPVISAMIEFIGMFLVIILIVQLLKRRGIFNDSHQQVFDRLVTEFTLPAIVFGLLTTTTLRAEWALPVFLAIGAVLVAVLIAWGACRMLGVSPATTGSIIIISAFGSTYTVGTPVLEAVFGPLSEEVALGHFIGTFGYALPFFTLGILIAGYFGLREKGEYISASSFLKRFIVSPVFLAFALGLAISLLLSAFNLPGADIYNDIFTDFFIVVQHSVELLVWIAIGLLLRPVRLRTLVPLLFLVAAIQLIILPAIVFAGGYAAGLPVMQRYVAGILAAMPSGAMAAVIADRYGCDGKLAAAIVIGTYLISLVTLPLVLMLAPVA
jgi:predicted permease